MIDPITLSVLSALGSPAAAIVWAMPTVVDDDAKALEAVNKITSDFDAAMQAFMQKYRAADPSERDALFTNEYPQAMEAAAQLEKIVKAHPKSEAARTAAEWAFQSTQGAAGWAANVLVNNFIDSPVIETIAMRLNAVSTDAIKALEKLRTDGPTERIQALAALSRGKQLANMVQFANHFSKGYEFDPRIGDPNTIGDDLKKQMSAPGAADKYRAQAEKVFKLCVENYADIEVFPGYSKVGSDAERALFEMQNLIVGCVAPDIEGVDADGVSFKLSDYRGQVVVLDFWGFW